MQDPWLGEIALVAFNFAPNGWAFCNGQLLSIQQNTALFSLLGTTYGGDGVNTFALAERRSGLGTQYGGDGVNTFALPDLRSRVPLHFGQGNGLSNYAQGSAGGAESVTLTS